MHRRRLTGPGARRIAPLVAAALAAASSARAQPEESLESVPAGTQELGARLGLGLGGRVTPGGLRVSGLYLYRLAERDWFDGSVSFTFGGGDAACFRDRDDELLCDHGFAGGFAADVLAGVRRFFPPRGRFVPYVRGGVGLRVASFSGDVVRGVAVPLWAGTGVRAQVHESVAVTGGAEARLGIGWFNRDLGIEPQASFAIVAGVDFVLE